MDGRAIDISAIKGITNYDIFDWVVKNVETLKFDQVIQEFPDASGTPQWIHIGYAEKPRKQVLKALKSNGKTVYQRI